MHNDTRHGRSGFADSNASEPEKLALRFARSSARLRSDWTFAAIDAVIVIISYAAALGLRGLDAPGVLANYRFAFIALMPLIVMLHIATNLMFGVYGHEWEYASIEEARRLIAGTVTAIAVLLFGLVTYQEITASSGRLVPIGVVVLGAVFTVGGMGAVRFRARMFSFNRSQEESGAVPTIVIGTGHTAAEVARTANREQQRLTRVIGFVSVEAGYSDKRIAELPVLGSLADVRTVVEDYDVEQLLIAENLEPSTIRDLVDLFLEVDVRLRIIPRLEDVLTTNGRIQDIRDVAVGDLLRRPPVDTDLDRVSELLTGKRVLVTGAGGSIGSEIVRQIARFSPSSLIALDNDETHLFEGGFSWAAENVTVTTVLCDIRDEVSLGVAFADHLPQIVYHAAAHKHVPILEQYPAEAVKTNIIGTANVLEACNDYGVDRFVLVSTDKAVEPSSAMGSSKRVAEMLTQAASTRWGSDCTHTAVRFGNVLGSRGSVVPTFMRQIKSGGPVTVTDPDMLRYFMTVDEAVQLVLQASSLAEGGEVFVLDMGDPVRIGDLAHRMIRLAGLIPGRDIDVEITGRRPGEKQCEILATGPLEASELSRIHVTWPGHPGLVTLTDLVNQFRVLADHGSRAELREFLLAVSNQTWHSNEVVDLTAHETDAISEAS